MTKTAADFSQTLRRVDWTSIDHSAAQITLNLMPGIELAEAGFGWTVTAAGIGSAIMKTPSEAVLAWIEKADRPSG